MRTPNYSASQKIGTLGKRAFIGEHPDHWFAESEPVQNSDFGFDMSMWLEGLGRILGRFAVQLKAGANVDTSGRNGEEFIQVSITPESCNLYLQDGQPVLLVFIALRNEFTTTGSELYYLWIEDELRKRLGSRIAFDDTDPGSMTFRIPVSNRLTKQLDISMHLSNYWSHTRISNQLRSPEGTAALSTVSSLSPRAQTALTSTDPKNLDRWLTHDTMSGNNLWPTPRTGTAVAKLKQISEFLSHGNTASADLLIDELSQQNIEDADVLAELKYQQGRRAFLDGTPQQAFDHFSKASNLQPNRATYYAAELEACVAASIASSRKLPPELMDRAHQFPEDADVQFQLVRIYALHQDFESAEQTIARLSEPDRVKANTLYLAIRGDWNATLQSADAGISQFPGSRAISLLKTLRIRALLNIFTGEDGIVGVGGRPDLHLKDAFALRDATMEALRDAQSSGWPINSEMLLDCASAVCVTFGPSKELVALVSDFAKKRPKLRDVQETLARIATFFEEPSTAIAAIKTIEEPAPVDMARLVLLYSESGAHRDAVTTAMLHILDCPHDELNDMAIAMAAVSAYRLGSLDDEHALLRHLSHGCFTAQALHRFIKDCLRTPQKRDELVARLWEDSMSGQENFTLQDNVINFLRSDRDVDLDRIIELCSIIATRRNLTEMESEKYSSALLARGRHLDVVSFTTRAQSFYPSSESLGLTRALALEKLGQPSAAAEVLRRFDSSIRTDLVDARSQLMLRTGEMDALVELTKNALASSSDRSDRFHFQRALTTLLSRRDRTQYYEAAWRLGELALQDVEQEEGVFLLHFLMATSGIGFEVSEDRVQEFRDRASNFTEKFPTSSILRMGHIPEHASATETLAHLQSVAGMTQDGAEARRKASEIGERMGSHIPLSFRARGYAPFAANLIDLLRICINSWHTGESSRILVGDPAFPPVATARPPILDLATVILLVELDLFEKLFSVWTAIAVPKESVSHLADLMFGPLANEGSGLIDKVTTAIRNNHHRIVQPLAPFSGADGFAKGEFATIREEVVSHRFCYLTVDLSAAAILRADAKTDDGHIGLWDFMRAGEERGSIDSAQASLVRLRVASWNTRGTPLQASDMVAASLGAKRDGSTDDGPVTRAVEKFFFDRDSQSVLSDCATVLTQLARNTSSTSAVASAWFVRFLYREALVARTFSLNASTDSLSAHLAVLAALSLNGELDSLPTMEFVWRTIETVRVDFGGSQDKHEFFRFLGKHTATLLNRVAMKHGLDSATTEAAMIGLIFSQSAPGTQDRSVVEDAYFAQTRALQN